MKQTAVRLGGGRRVRRLLDETMGVGDHQAVWDGLDDARRPRPPGTFFLSMSLDGRSVDKGVNAVLLR